MIEILFLPVLIPIFLLVGAFFMFLKMVLIDGPKYLYNRSVKDAIWDIIGFFIWIFVLGIPGMIVYGCLCGWRWDLMF